MNKNKLTMDNLVFKIFIFTVVSNTRISYLLKETFTLTHGIVIPIFADKYKNDLNNHLKLYKTIPTNK